MLCVTGDSVVQPENKNVAIQHWCFFFPSTKYNDNYFILSNDYEHRDENKFQLDEKNQHISFMILINSRCFSSHSKTCCFTKWNFQIVGMTYLRVKKIMLHLFSHFQGSNRSHATLCTWNHCYSTAHDHEPTFDTFSGANEKKITWYRIRICWKFISPSVNHFTFKLRLFILRRFRNLLSLSNFRFFFFVLFGSHNTMQCDPIESTISIQVKSVQFSKLIIKKIMFHGQINSKTDIHFF